MAALLTTLFVPTVVLLVPLYIEIVHPPLIGGTFVDSYWAIWLPEAASAFNVVLMKRFFDNLPREIFEAARIDGCGPVRLFVSIVLPMSKPILGVVSIFAVLASWKDFLWPLLVLTDTSKQPLSVRLPAIQGQTELGVFLAAMLIACLVPIIGFLILQRSGPARDRAQRSTERVISSPCANRVAHNAMRLQTRIWPLPVMTYLMVVSSRSPIGPRACNF